MRLIKKILFGIIFISIFFIAQHNTYALSTEIEEKTCTDIGFQPRTEAHAECVLELFERKKKQGQAKNSQTKVDGTPEHIACEKFGFIVGSAPYSDCRLKMDVAKRDAQQKQAAYELAQRKYEMELRQYQEQIARYEKEKERREGEAMMRFGLSLLGGTSPYFSENLANAGRASLGLPPAPPVAPQIQNFNITSPGGRMTNCSVVGNNINCY